MSTIVLLFIVGPLTLGAVLGWVLCCAARLGDDMHDHARGEREATRTLYPEHLRGVHADPATSLRASTTQSAPTSAVPSSSRRGGRAPFTNEQRPAGSTPDAA